LNKSLSLSLWNRQTSKRYLIDEKSQTQGEISEDEVQDSTHHSSTNRMYKHRLSLSKVGHIKQHYISSEIVHGQCSTVLEAHIIWHLVDKLSRDGYCFSPGIIITKTNHSVANLKCKSVMISKRKQNGSLLFLFYWFRLGIQWFIRCQASNTFFAIVILILIFLSRSWSPVFRATVSIKLKVDFIVTVVYLHDPIPILLPNNSYKPITNTALVRARLCKLQNRVHSTRSRK